MTATVDDQLALEFDQPRPLGELLAEARRERDAGMAIAEDAEDYRGGWDRKLIDQAIAYFALQGTPFSANDLRPWLPDVRTTLMGSRFTAAAKRGEIRPCGWVTSTKRNTHAKPVGKWIGVPSTEGVSA